jgi:hypothetical protein
MLCELRTDSRRPQAFVSVSPRPFPTDCSFLLEDMCSSCGKPSPRCYTEGWICFTPGCKQFWMLPTGIGPLPVPPGFNLTYNPEFLSPVKTPEESNAIPYSVIPPLPVHDPDRIQDAGGRDLWKGERSRGPQDRAGCDDCRCRIMTLGCRLGL